MVHRWVYDHLKAIFSDIASSVIYLQIPPPSPITTVQSGQDFQIMIRNWYKQIPKKSQKDLLTT